jgi:hypothetical protein
MSAAGDSHTLDIRRVPPVLRSDIVKEGVVKVFVSSLVPIQPRNRYVVIRRCRNAPHRFEEYKNKEEGTGITKQLYQADYDRLQGCDGDPQCRFNIKFTDKTSCAIGLPTEAETFEWFEIVRKLCIDPSRIDSNHMSTGPNEWFVSLMPNPYLQFYGSYLLVVSADSVRLAFSDKYRTIATWPLRCMEYEKVATKIFRVRTTNGCETPWCEFIFEVKHQSTCIQIGDAISLAKSNCHELQVEPFLPPQNTTTILPGRNPSHNSEAPDIIPDTSPTLASLTKTSKHGLNQIEGLEVAKAALMRLFVSEPISNAVGAILYGPPGCGKRMLSEGLARALNAKIMHCPCSLFWAPNDQRRLVVHDVMQHARDNSPCVVYLQNVDVIAKNFRDTETIMQSIWIAFDNIVADQQLKIWIVGSTNHPLNVCPSLLQRGRFREQVYVPLPDPTVRLRVITERLRIEKPDANDDELRVGLSRKTTLFSYMELKQMCMTLVQRLSDNASGDLDNDGGVYNKLLPYIERQLLYDEIEARKTSVDVKSAVECGKYFVSQQNSNRSSSSAEWFLLKLKENPALPYVSLCLTELTKDDVILRELNPSHEIITWPLSTIRAFKSEPELFSIETGRRAPVTKEGWLDFETVQGESGDQIRQLFLARTMKPSVTPNSLYSHEQ